MRHASSSGRCGLSRSGRGTATPRPAAGKGAARGDGGAHPDQIQAASDIASALGRALGAEVKVRPTRTGYRAEMAFASPEEALELADRVAPRRR